MPKRNSSLPTLPKLEYHGEVSLELGGKHGYKNVKKHGHGFQGACNKSKTYTGIKNNPKEAAIALATKKFKEKNKREPTVPSDEESPVILPNYDPGAPPPTIPSHPIPLLLILLVRLSAARQLRRSLLALPPTRARGRSSRPSR